MQNDIENIIGVLDDTMDTMNKSDVLRNNLIQQQIEIEKQITVLEGQLHTHQLVPDTCQDKSAPLAVRKAFCLENNSTKKN